MFLEEVNAPMTLSESQVLHSVQVPVQSQASGSCGIPNDIVPSEFD